MSASRTPGADPVNTHSPNSDYLGRRRRMLLDVHIPDWDPGFLASYDPAEIVRCYELAHVNAVMLYCNSHVGLCYWPTVTGRMHPGTGGRDFVGEVVAGLRSRDIAVCAYQSVAWDAYAVDQNPAVEVVPALVVDGEPVVSWRPRHKVACLNKSDYLTYQKAQLEELLGRYDFDSLFLDMMFWSCICICSDCQDRWASETGNSIPETVEWRSREWASFHAARSRWADEFAQELISYARRYADIPVYQNFAPSFFWFGGKPLRAFRNDTFVGADLYGGRSQQLFAEKLMLAVSPQHPPEYMTCRSPATVNQVTVKSEDELLLHTLGAMTLSCASLFTDPINPEGTLERGAYEQIGRVFRRTEPFEPFLGGQHIEDIAVYYSSSANVDLRHSGTPISSLQLSVSSATPHLNAAVGASRILQRTHLAAGVATYRQLDDLHRFKVLVVPDLTRITVDEAQAFREYVLRGGRLYASGATSLLNEDASATSDFLLADLFGVHCEGFETGDEVYLRPLDAETEGAIYPQRFVSWKPIGADIPRLGSSTTARVLAALSLPYGYPAAGTRHDRNWANSYSSPPWHHTDHPVVVENVVGKGRVIYSAVPVERDLLTASSSLFAHLIQRLLGDDVSLRGEAHPAVWIEAFDQPEKQRCVVSALNYQADLPPIATKARFSLTLAEGTRVVRVYQAPDRQPSTYEISTTQPNVVTVTTDLDPFAMHVIEYRSILDDRRL